MLICPKCATVNQTKANFCSHCGHQFGHNQTGQRFRFYLLVLLLLVAGFIFHQYIWNDKQQPVTEKVKAPPRKSKTPKKKYNRMPKRSRTAVNTPPQHPHMKLTMATIIIKDTTGVVLSELFAPVLAGGWVALPKKICLGGAEWILKSQHGKRMVITGGLYRDYDDIGLWRIDEDDYIEGPKIHPWTPDKPLFWQSLEPQAQPVLVGITGSSQFGYFLEAIIVSNPGKTGVLIQNHHIVGWTFTDKTATAYLWQGETGTQLHPETRVEDFYRITFADSREEKLTLALSPKENYTDIGRLWAMADAFRYPPRLALENTPSRLQRASIINEMLSLITKAKQSGYERDVADIFDFQILTEAKDARLLIAAAEAIAHGLGFERAIELTESAVAELWQISPEETNQVEKFLSAIYQEWISAMLQNDNLPGAYQVYQQGSYRFPNDLTLQLMGVELALADDDWREAEQLLYTFEFPPALNDRVENLQSKISELKAREGKVVVNFPPGSRHVRVESVLNQNVQLPFYIDTGASFVSIPRAAAQELGITIDSRHKLYEVATAGGIVYAPLVTLESITIEGQQVQDVKAFIMDLPNHSEMGLLGMNFLSRFRMDMDTEKGVLLLEPR